MCADSVRAAPAQAAAWRRLRAVLFVLLAGNALIYAFAGTASEALDASAWLILLALFALETGRTSPLPRRTRSVIRVLRLAAAAAVVTAALAYIAEGDTLDALNSMLWIAVVAALEMEVRCAALPARRLALTCILVTLYCGLGVLVLAWAWQGAWFDAYDALLWLVAFVTIELDILRAPAARSPASRISGQTPP